jgi:hypothetical protein
MRRLNAHLALGNLEATRKFERSSSNLTIVLIVLTVVLVVLTAAIAWYTVVLARKDSPVAERQAASVKKSLGPWKAKLTIPGSALLPEQNSIVKCSLSKPSDGGFGFIGVKPLFKFVESHDGATLVDVYYELKFWQAAP